MRDKLISQGVTEEEDNSTLDQYNKLFSQYAEGSVDRFNREVAPQRSRLISEEAALGRLDSPASRYSLNRFDDQANSRLSDMIAQLAGTQAQGTVDYSKFGQELGLKRDTLSSQMDQFNRKLELDSYLGRRDLDVRGDKSRDFLDYANTASNFIPKVGINISKSKK